MRRAAIAVTILATALSCGRRPVSVETQPCNADEVLRAVAQALQTGNLGPLDGIVVRLEDILPSDTRGKVDAAEKTTFDNAMLEDNRRAIRDVAHRTRGLRLMAVSVGRPENGVVVEGTGRVVDRIDGSDLVFEKDNEEVVVRVATLLRSGSCWKLEYFGTGKVGLAAPVVSSGRSRRRVEQGTGFRRFSMHDLCSGLAIYRSPSKDEKIGTLVEGFRRYRDPESGRVFEAVLIQSMATGHVRGIWMSYKQLLATYVDQSDAILQGCGWSVREEEVSPLPEDVPAQ